MTKKTEELIKKHLETELGKLNKEQFEVLLKKCLPPKDKNYDSIRT